MKYSSYLTLYLSPDKRACDAYLHHNYNPIRRRRSLFHLAFLQEWRKWEYAC